MRESLRVGKGLGCGDSELEGPPCLKKKTILMQLGISV